MKKKWEKGVSISGYPFWPLVGLPWLVGVIVICKAIVNAVI